MKGKEQGLPLPIAAAGPDQQGAKRAQLLRLQAKDPAGARVASQVVLLVGAPGVGHHVEGPVDGVGPEPAVAAAFDDQVEQALQGRRPARPDIYAGALAALPSSLSNLAIATAWTGDFAAATSLIHECDNLMAAIGSRQAPFASFRLHALQGTAIRTRFPQH